jgi:hypothetical protein
MQYKKIDGENIQEKDTDMEFAEELTGEEHAVKKVQDAFLEMYAQAGYYDEEKEY